VRVRRLTDQNGRKLQQGTHAVREEEIPRNVARNVRCGTPRLRRFELLTADEARTSLAAAQDHRLHALSQLALRT
jgi:hypothetical protein